MTPIKKMAQRVLRAKAEGDPRYLALLIAMSARIGSDPNTCAAWIQEQANAPEESPTSPEQTPA